MSCQPRGPVDDCCNRPPVERHQSFIFGNAGNDARVEHLAARCALNVVFEVGKHLEVMRNFRIELAEEIVKRVGQISIVAERFQPLLKLLYAMLDYVGNRLALSFL